MANSVECLIEVSEVVVKDALDRCSRCFAIKTLQSKICSTVRRPAPKLASP